MNLPGKLPPYRKLQRLIDWLNALRDHVASLQPMQSFNTLTNHTSSGISRQSLGTESSSSSSGMVFRGEWRADVDDYVAGNLVIIRGGISAGAYIAMLDVPAGEAPVFPDTGVYWASISRNFAGAWA